MLKKTWNNIEIILITLSILIAMFTVGLMVGVYISSEKMSTENIRQYQTIQQQKERIRELQEFKQLKEIYR